MFALPHLAGGIAGGFFLQVFRGGDRGCSVLSWSQN
jgi:hypothetical protein